jgi:hypothetical protein
MASAGREEARNTRCARRGWRPGSGDDVACPETAGYGDLTCPRLEHANAGNLPGSGKSCGQDMGPLVRGVNPFPETVMDLEWEISTRMRRAGAWPAGRPHATGHVLCRVARRRPACSRNVPGRRGSGSPSVTEGAVRQTRYPFVRRRPQVQGQALCSHAERGVLRAKVDSARATDLPLQACPPPDAC